VREPVNGSPPVWVTGCPCDYVSTSDVPLADPSCRPASAALGQERPALEREVYSAKPIYWSVLQEPVRGRVTRAGRPAVSVLYYRRHRARL
jgi:hypothetical protein